MQMLDTLADIERRYLAIEEEMGQPDVVTDHVRLAALGRERAEIEDAVTAYRRLRVLDDEISATTLMADEETDAELAALARDELSSLTAEREAQVAAVRQMLVPRDPNDEKDVIVEIRAGAGGEEAALFAAELYRMYPHYAERQRWKTELVSTQRERASAGSRRSSSRSTAGARTAIFKLRERRPSRAARARHRSRAGASTPRPRRWPCMPEAEEVDVRDQRRRPADRRLPLHRPRRPEREHDRQRGAHHPPADRPGRHLPGREDRSSRTATRRWPCCAPGCTTSSCSRRAERGAATSAARRSAPATAARRSAPTTSRRTA